MAMRLFFPPLTTAIRGSSRGGRSTCQTVIWPKSCVRFRATTVPSQRICGLGEGKWKATVRALMELTPIIVLDVQIPAEHVLEEVEWIVDRGYAYKTLLVTAATSIGHAELGDLGFRTITTDVSSCLRQLRLLTAVPSMLPIPSADVARPAAGPVLDRDVFAHRRGQLLDLYEKLVAGDQEPHVEGELHELFRPGDGPPTETPRSDDSARLTMSLDRVLSLLDSWGGRVSLATHVRVDGFAMSEVGYHVNETFLIASSGRDPVPSAARSVLAALIRPSTYEMETLPARSSPHRYPGLSGRLLRRARTARGSFAIRPWQPNYWMTGESMRPKRWNAMFELKRSAKRSWTSGSITCSEFTRLKRRVD